MSTTPVSAMSALRAASRVASRVVSSGAGSDGGTEGAGVGGGGAFWELLGLQRPVMVAAVVLKALSVSVTCVDSVYSMVVSRCCPCIFKGLRQGVCSTKATELKALAPWLIAAFLHNRGRDCTSPDKASVFDLF